jgi:ectoine hydrolase
MLSRRLRAGDKLILHENMTFHFMTGLWMQDWGFEITESIVIGKFGPECLANVPRKLIIKT